MAEVVEEVIRVAVPVVAKVSEGTTQITVTDSLTVMPPIAGPGWAALRTRVDGKVVRMATYYDSTVVDLLP